MHKRPLPDAPAGAGEAAVAPRDAHAHPPPAKRPRVRTATAPRAAARLGAARLGAAQRRTVGRKVGLLLKRYADRKTAAFHRPRLALILAAARGDLTTVQALLYTTAFPADALHRAGSAALRSRHHNVYPVLCPRIFAASARDTIYRDDYAVTAIRRGHVPGLVLALRHRGELLRSVSNFTSFLGHAIRRGHTAVLRACVSHGRPGNRAFCPTNTVQAIHAGKPAIAVFLAKHTYLPVRPGAFTAAIRNGYAALLHTLCNANISSLRPREPLFAAVDVKSDAMLTTLLSVATKEQHRHVNRFIRCLFAVIRRAAERNYATGLAILLRAAETLDALDSGTRHGAVVFTNTTPASIVMAALRANALLAARVAYVYHLAEADRLRASNVFVSDPVVHHLICALGHGEPRDLRRADHMLSILKHPTTNSLADVETRKAILLATVRMVKRAGLAWALRNVAYPLPDAIQWLDDPTLRAHRPPVAELRDRLQRTFDATGSICGRDPASASAPAPDPDSDSEDS